MARLFLSILLILPAQEGIRSPHFKQEDPYGLSCMLVLLHTLPGVALAIVLALS